MWGSLRGEATAILITVTSENIFGDFCQHLSHFNILVNWWLTDKKKEKRGSQKFLNGDHFKFEGCQKATLWKNELGALSATISNDMINIQNI